MTITLSKRQESGELLTVEVAPQRGMNLIRIALNSCELLDPKSRPLFEQRSAGLGALIGPHFHHRPTDALPPAPPQTLFPHFATLSPWGKVEPFSHGIARYVPWKVTEQGPDHLVALLCGSDFYKGVALKTLEGQDFTMEFQVHLQKTGLFLDYRVQSEKPSVIGLHYYYRLAQPALIKGAFLPTYRDAAGWQPMPHEWLQQIPIRGDLDFGFLPQNPSRAETHFHSADFSLTLVSHTLNEEHSIQVYHPENSSFCCIEPISAKNPRTPQQTTNLLQVGIYPV